MSNYTKVRQIFASTTEKAKTIYEDEQGNFTVQEGGDANWRNNNPGNLKAGDFSTRHGAIGAVKLLSSDKDKMAVFPNVETGLKAQDELIRHNYLDGDMAHAISKYAHQSVNPTANIKAKIADISRNLKLPGSTPMSSIATDPKKFQEFKDQMIKYEGKNHPEIRETLSGRPENEKLRAEWATQQPVDQLSEKDIHRLMASQAYRDRTSPLYNKTRSTVDQWHKQHSQKHSDSGVDATGRRVRFAAATGGSSGGGEVRVSAYDRVEGGKQQHVGAYTRSRPQSRNADQSTA